MAITLPLWALVLAALAFVLLLLLIWSSRRTLVRRVSLVPRRGIDELLPSLAALTGEPVTDGNRVDVLQDDAFFDALLADIELARSSVHYETYVWWRGEVCRRVADGLARRARDGVEVRLLVDAIGALPMEAEIEARLAESGCQVGRFHPYRLRHIGKVNSRDHRKLAVVDGRIAYFMGHGVAEPWCGGVDGRPVWRDTAVRIEGPAVRGAQAVFLRNWLNVHDELAVGARHFPSLETRGTARVHIAESDPVGTYSEVEVLLEAALAAARESILIQNPYFVPHEAMIELLGEAVGRGVEVAIMLPAWNDSRLVRHASHKFYGPLLARGVRLYEYHRTFMHQKIVVVDGRWSLAGSTNFDHRSLQINREVSVGILDREVAGRLAEAFARDLAHCREITGDAWRRRPPLNRLADDLAFLVREQI